MNILVTGSKGMVGTALIKNLRTIQNGTNATRPNICIDEIYEYDVDSMEAELDEYCKKANFVFDLAGVNRPNESDDFMKVNVGFVTVLLDTLKKYNNKATIMFSSSIQATLSGRFENSQYGLSKRASEELFFKYSIETGAKVAVYRFPNVMGHSRPKYNSAVSTFCWAVANDEEFTIYDPNVELELLYIDDLIEGMFDLLEGKEVRCEFDGVSAYFAEKGRYCYVPVTYKVTVGKVVSLLKKFREQSETLIMPTIPEGSFEKKLFSLYLTYLPVNKFKRPLKMNVDNRGSFTEVMKTCGCGQVSVNVAKPGVTKGGHWHNSKWERFIVVSGNGVIKEINAVTGEQIEFEVSGKKMESVYMIPGWSHSITNTSSDSDLIFVIICNETFEPENPDTFRDI